MPSAFSSASRPRSGRRLRPTSPVRAAAAGRRGSTWHLFAARGCGSCRSGRPAVADRAHQPEPSLTNDRRPRRCEQRAPELVGSKPNSRPPQRIRLAGRKLVDLGMLLRQLPAGLRQADHDADVSNRVARRRRPSRAAGRRATRRSEATSRPPISSPERSSTSSSISSDGLPPTQISSAWRIVELTLPPIRCAAEQIDDRAECGVRRRVAPGDAAEVGRAFGMEVDELREGVAHDASLVAESERPLFKRAEDRDDLALVGGEQRVIAIACRNRRRIAGGAERCERLGGFGDRRLALVVLTQLALRRARPLRAMPGFGAIG